MKLSAVKLPGRQFGDLRFVLTALSTFAKIVVRAGMFVVIAPIIGPANQGTIVVTSAWAAIICLLIGFGLQVRVLREVATASGQAGTILRSDTRTMVSLLAPAAVMGTITAILVLRISDHTVFALIFVATVGTVFGDYCSAFLRALGKYKLEAQLSVVLSALQFTLVVTVAVMSRSVIAVASAMMVSRVIYAYSVYRAAQQSSAQLNAPGFAYDTVVSVLRNAWPYAIDGFLSVLLGQLDVVLLDRLSDRGTVGIYSAGNRLVQMLLVIPAISVNVVVPAIARAMGTPQAQLEARRLLRGLAAVAVAGAMAIIVGGPLFTAHILGKGFLPLNALWPGFALLVLARFYEAYFGTLMIAAGSMVSRVLMQLVAFAAILTCGVLTIPVLGARGMIDSVAFVYCVVGIFYAYRLAAARQALGMGGPAAMASGIIIMALVVADAVFRR